MQASEISQRLSAVRAAGPLVQCLTNAVVMNYTANALLAAGCAPAMVDIPEEAGLFAGIASAVLINTGTPYAEQRQAMLEAAQAAHKSQTPWVLDPVAVGALPVRTQLAKDVLEFSPTAIRGNPSEIIALAGVGAGGRGVDAVHSPEDAQDAAQNLASKYQCTVAISGEVDLITDGQQTIRIHNSTQRLTQITGGGCALGALMGAFLAVEEQSSIYAIAAANAFYTIAAELAAQTTQGPGSFMPQLLDQLAAVDAETIKERLSIS